MEKKILDKKWKTFDIIKCFLGLILYTASVNLFIVPNNLFTGGLLGLSQLIRNLIINLTGISFPFDISSIIYYSFNIILCIIALKKISKEFFIKTLISITFVSILLIVIPIPTTPLVSDLLTNVLIGGIGAGIGVGMALSSGSSTGGTDIIGVLFSSKSKIITVGNLNLLFNLIVFGISGLTYGFSVMIFSMIYAAFEAFIIDRNHMQNIQSQVLIFTKNDPLNIVNFIIKEYNRNATFWNATGGYSKAETHIIYTVMDQNERQKLAFVLKTVDPDAFMVGDEGVKVDSRFDKHLWKG